MQKCIKLSRLPKPGKFKSLLIRGQIPGSLPENYAFVNKANILDPSHPSANSSHRFFPRFKPPSEDFILHTYPFALLSSDPGYPCQEPQQIESWKERVERSVQHPDFNPKNPQLLPPRLLQLHYQNAKQRVPVSLLITTLIKRTSKKAVVRNRIRRKIKTALELITVRGAEVKEVEGKESLVMSEEKASKMSSEGFRRGWTYIFYPNLSIFLMPYKKLIPMLEAALLTVNRDINALERKWAMTLKQTRSPVKQPNPTPNPSPVVGISPMLGQPTTVRPRKPPRKKEVPDSSQNKVTTDLPPSSSPSNVTDANGSDRPQSPLSFQDQGFFQGLVPGFERRSSQPITSEAWQSFISEVKEDDNVEDVGWDVPEDLDSSYDELSQPFSSSPSAASKISFTPRPGQKLKPIKATGPVAPFKSPRRGNTTSSKDSVKSSKGKTSESGRLTMINPRTKTEAEETSSLPWSGRKTNLTQASTQPTPSESPHTDADTDDQLSSEERWKLHMFKSRPLIMNPRSKKTGN